MNQYLLVSLVKLEGEISYMPHCELRSNAEHALICLGLLPGSSTCLPQLLRRRLLCCRRVLQRDLILLLLIVDVGVTREDSSHDGREGVLGSERDWARVASALTRLGWRLRVQVQRLEGRADISELQPYHVGLEAVRNRLVVEAGRRRVLLGEMDDDGDAGCSV